MGSSGKNDRRLHQSSRLDLIISDTQPLGQMISVIYY
ncbi:hypothetical protein Rifp1Sym_bs00070 [endosymbiont of Riftia pachyptila (vent Ph05)]|uniref:Uncharacterized protein n=1 Tax=endosymbiont of Riftia pachyptila (vent Ph05) TaxID=1048808 RepID=G2DDW7_9GAMM|nr:hypothetical protein Rifp1Sym_bs00070 [endosymbiont of Riftia pachyptila (vent Ph05)]